MKRIICFILMISIVLTAALSLFGCTRTITVWPDDETSENPEPTGTEAASATPKRTPAPEGKAFLYNLSCKKHPDWQMMSFIIKTSDEKIIVIDGGYDVDADNLVNTLKKITGQNVPVVDAWFLTHCHEDHIDAFSKIFSTSSPRIDLKKVYYAFPSESFIKKYAPGTADSTYRNFTKALSNIDAGKIVVMKDGDQYNVGNAVVDVLLTYSETIVDDAMNESSTIFTVTIAGQKILFLGDCGAQQGARLRASGKDIKADIVQLGHHGNASLTNNFYRKIEAKAALWCAPQWLFDNNYAAQGFNTGAYTTVSLYNYMVKNLKCKVHFVTLDNGFEFELPYDFTKEVLPREV